MSQPPRRGWSRPMSLRVWKCGTAFKFQTVPQTSSGHVRGRINLTRERRYEGKCSKLSLSATLCTVTVFPRQMLSQQANKQHELVASCSRAKTRTLSIVCSPEISLVPSGVHARHVTWPWWPTSVCTHWQLSMSQMRIVLSAEQVANRLPSGLACICMRTQGEHGGWIRRVMWG